MLSYLLLVVVLPTVFAIDFSACTGGLPTPTSVTVDGCATAPCHVSDGDTVALTVSFVSAIEAASLTNEVSSYAFGTVTGVPLSAPNDSACTTGASCPVKAGQAVTVNIRFKLTTAAKGGIKFVFEYRAVNGSGIGTCLRIAFSID